MKPANDNSLVGSSVRFVVEPRLVPAVKAARRLHLSAAEFSDKSPALTAACFPAPCRITGHYDLIAIDAWLDKQAGLSSAAFTPTQIDTSRLVAQRLAAFE